MTCRGTNIFKDTVVWNQPVGSSDFTCIAASSRRRLNSGPERMLKEASVTHLETPSRYEPGGTQEIVENLVSGPDKCVIIYL